MYSFAEAWVCGEPDVGHHRLDLIRVGRGAINDQYAAAGLPPYYAWYKPPPPDDGRRFWGDYDEHSPLRGGGRS